MLARSLSRSSPALLFSLLAAAADVFRRAVRLLLLCERRSVAPSFVRSLCVHEISERKKERKKGNEKKRRTKRRRDGGTEGNVDDAFVRPRVRPLSRRLQADDDNDGRARFSSRAPSALLTLEHRRGSDSKKAPFADPLGPISLAK